MKLLTDLYDYQQEAVAKLSKVKVGALYMEMGTGKTRTALELLQRRLAAGKVEQALWLCPFSVQKDLPELLSEHAEGFEDVIRVAGIESLSNSIRITEELMSYVMQAPTFLIVDESLLVKNPFAYRTQRVTEIAQKCPYRLILNGTPISRNEADLFAQWYILDWRILGYRSYYSFSANHLEMDATRPGRISRVLDTDYLARKIAPYTYECRRSDVLDLPAKRYHTCTFWLEDEQMIHYEEVAERLLLEVDDMRPDTIYRLFGCLQAVTSGFCVQFSNDGKHSSTLRMYQPKDNPRIRKLMDVLDVIGDDQAVIYCHYTQEIEDICAVLGDSALPFYGDMSVTERQKNKTAFKNGEARYLVANKSCAQFGLNLQFCHREIFYDNDWDWSTRAQAEDRLHRAGQTQIVDIYDIYSNNTLEETIQSCLANKERLSETFKRKVKDYNGAKDMARAAIFGHVEGMGHGKDIPAEKRI